MKINWILKCQIIVKIPPSKIGYLLHIVPRINCTEKNKKCDVSRVLFAGSSAKWKQLKQGFNQTFLVFNFYLYDPKKYYKERPLVQAVYGVIYCPFKNLNEYFRIKWNENLVLGTNDYHRICIKI